MCLFEIYFDISLLVDCLVLIGLKYIKSPYLYIVGI